MTPSGIEPELVAQYLNQLRHRGPPFYVSMKAKGMLGASDVTVCPFLLEAFLNKRSHTSLLYKKNPVVNILIRRHILGTVSIPDREGD